MRACRTAGAGLSLRWSIPVVLLGLVLATPGAAETDGAGGEGTPGTEHSANQPLEGITFAEAPGTLFAPARELGEALGLAVSWDPKQQQVKLDGEVVSDEQVRSLVDGTRLLPVRELTAWGVGVTWDGDAGVAHLHREERDVPVRWGEKRVAVNLEEQQMRAWQGERLLLDTRISSGRPGMETPKGSFSAGPLKRRMLISEKVRDAKMPWSVQVRGDVVIHGFPSVPPHAASHGCVRVPLTGANPAHWFYTWVETGTPIEIRDAWPEDNSGSEAAS